jgi:hypothetical protein
MKTTIKTYGDDVVVKPSPVASSNTVWIELHIETPGHQGGHRSSVFLNRDQAEALVFGIEVALESAMPLPEIDSLAKTESSVHAGFKAVA